MAVKVIIRRKAPKSKEAQLLPLLLELRSKAVTQPGYITGETLRNVKDPEDYIVISTWKTLEEWRSWERNQERGEILGKIEALLGEKGDYGIYLYG